MVRTVKPYVPREFRVPFTRRLTNAVVVSPKDPLPATSTPATQAPVATAAPSVVPPPSEPAAIPPAPAADSLVTEISAQLAADRKAIEAVLASVRQVAAELQGQTADRLAQWQKAAVELGLNIAAKLLHERLAADDFPLESMIRDMAGGMFEDEVVTVRLNPADLQLLEQRLDGQPLLPGQTDPTLVADPTLGRAECRMEGRTSVLLLDLPRQLAQMRDDLIGSLAHART